MGVGGCGVGDAEVSAGGGGTSGVAACTGASGVAACTGASGVAACTGDSVCAGGGRSVAAGMAGTAGAGASKSSMTERVRDERYDSDMLVHMKTIAATVVIRVRKLLAPRVPKTVPAPPPPNTALTPPPFPLCRRMIGSIARHTSTCRIYSADSIEQVLWRGRTRLSSEIWWTAVAIGLTFCNYPIAAMQKPSPRTKNRMAQSTLPA